VRQVLAVAAGAALAALGAVVLGEYDLRGTTAFVGFPLYAVAVTELVLAVGRRLAPLTLAAVAAVVAAGLSWALWISFNHFRNDVSPPWSSWAMVAVAAVATLAWGWSGRRRGSTDQGPSGPAEREVQGPSGPAEREVQGPSGPAEREVQGPSGAAALPPSAAPTARPASSDEQARP
jgi:hypothetical protein